jgi:hypothetical protein
MPSVPNSFPQVTWDAIGIGASLLCAVHCLLLPFMLAFAPALAHFLPGDEAVHRTLACSLAAVGLVAFRAGNSVTDVNVNISDVSCDFGVELHFLKGQEFTGNGERVRKRRASNLHDCSPRDRIGGCDP